MNQTDRFRLLPHEVRVGTRVGKIGAGRAVGIIEKLVDKPPDPNLHIRLSGRSSVFVRWAWGKDKGKIRSIYCHQLYNLQRLIDDKSRAVAEAIDADRKIDAMLEAEEKIEGMRRELNAG